MKSGLFDGSRRHYFFPRMSAVVVGSAHAQSYGTAWDCGTREKCGNLKALAGLIRIEVRSAPPLNIAYAFL
jgi:hypothetical protein